MIKPSASASSPDFAPDLSRETIAARIEPAIDEHATTVLNEVAASWEPRPMAAERRCEHRISCDVPALLVALADGGQALDLAPWRVTIRDLSRSGIGLSHVEPLPYRLVLLALDTAASEPIRLIARLKWCRFKRTNVYESGGQVIRIFKPGE